MTDHITIPSTAEEVDEQIAGAMALLTLGEWPLAAWLASRVRLDLPPGPKDGSVLSHLTPKGFAAKGIRGLSSENTVRRYVKTWLDENGKTYPALGETVALPTVEFPSNSKTDSPERGAQKVKDIQNNPAAVAKALANPETARKVAEHMEPEVRTALTDALVKEEFDSTIRGIGGDPDARPDTNLYPEWHRNITTGMTYLARAAEFAYAQRQQGDHELADKIEGEIASRVAGLLSEGYNVSEQVDL